MHVVSQDSSESEEEPLNNMIEVFQLSDSEFQSSIEEVLAARSDKAPRTTGPVTHSGAVAKQAAPTKLSDSARGAIREALFPASSG